MQLTGHHLFQLLSTMKPVIVFAPGAWHPANTFDSLAALLATDGYESQTIAFPAIHRTIKIKEPSLALEIAAARGVIEPLVEAGREVVLVMHSWGGVPGNSALGGLTVRERKALGKTGGVRHLVFMAAFVARIGQSVSDLSGPLPWLTIDVCQCFLTPLFFGFRVDWFIW